MKLSSISLFFPAYNEEKNIQKTIAQAQQISSQISSDYEIIIINDGSTDNTRNIIENIASTNPRIKIINHRRNRGYGVSIRSGISTSSKEWIFFSDSDGQFDLSELAKFIQYTKNYNLVFGYRKLRKDRRTRDINAWLWGILNRKAFGLKMKDINCAFKLFRADKIKPLHLVSSGAMINAEILAKLKLLGVNHIEIPVSHYHRKHGTPTGANLMVIIKALFEFIKIYISLNYSSK